MLMGQIVFKISGTTAKERHEFTKIARQLQRELKCQVFTRTFKGDDADWSMNGPSWLTTDDWYREVVLPKMTQHHVDIYNDLGFESKLIRVSRKRLREKYSKL